MIDDQTASPSETSTDYADVTEMFRRLADLEEGTAAYRRQRDAIIERCLPLADNIARRFRNRGESHEDLLQVARVGLVNAVNRFDVSAGTEFIGFAVPTMMGEVRRHFRDHGWAVKVPRRLKELNMSLNRAKTELSQELNRAPTASELAEHLGVDREEVVEGLIAANAYSTRSTDATIGSGEDDGYSIADTFGDLDANIEKVVDVETVRPLLMSLPERERIVLQLRFFENMSQSQIAERIGHSQMHVSRLLAKSLASLRSRVE
jgi:RNA polymerase sigma-B factor